MPLSSGRSSQAGAAGSECMRNPFADFYKEMAMQSGRTREVSGGKDNNRVEDSFCLCQFAFSTPYSPRIFLIPQHQPTGGVPS